MTASYNFLNGMTTCDSLGFGEALEETGGIVQSNFHLGLLGNLSHIGKFDGQPMINAVDSESISVEKAKTVESDEDEFDFDLHVSHKETLPAEVKLEAALITLPLDQDEWKCVVQESDDKQLISAVSKSTTTDEMKIWLFEASNVRQYQHNIQPTIPRRGFAMFYHFFKGPPPLKSMLINERDLLFCCALSPFDNSDIMHNQMLQTLHRALTNSKFDCARYGSHWEAIGFQGADPSSDLRGCGLLGLMVLVHFVTEPSLQKLCRSLYRLSLDKTQHFPFAVMGINVARIGLQAFREELFNKVCNSENRVVDIFFRTFAALCLLLFKIWSQQHKSILDSGFVIKDLEVATKRPKILLHDLQCFLNNKEITLDASDAAFFNLCAANSKGS